MFVSFRPVEVMVPNMTWRKLILITGSVVLAASVEAGATTCTYHLSGFVTDAQGEVFVPVPSPVYPGFAHVTGGRIFLLDVVTKALDLESALTGVRTILSIGEGYSPLVPYLNARGFTAVGLDRWYHRRPFPPTTAGGQMTDYVAEHRSQLVAADARALPFRSARFDLVVSSFVLHHLTLGGVYPDGTFFDGNQMLSEVGRVLKVGGRAVVTSITADAGGIAELKTAFAAVYPPNTFEWSVTTGELMITDVVSSNPMNIQYVRVMVRRIGPD